MKNPNLEIRSKSEARSFETCEWQIDSSITS